MSRNAPRPHDVILCDDVRQERNGKLILIGMYVDNVGVFSLPTTLPTLTFVCKWTQAAGEPIRGRYRVVGPSGAALGEMDVTKIPHAEGAQARLTILQLRPFTFPQAGTYRLVVKPPGGRSRMLYSFGVSLLPKAEGD